MKRLGKCQVHGCNQPARYGLYRTTDGKKEWIYVCRRHESEMGYENLMRREKEESTWNWKELKG